MSSLIVSNVPEFFSKTDLIQYFTGHLPSKGSIHYVLFPLASKKNKALIEFSSSEVANRVLHASHEIAGCSVKVSAAPRKTYTKISAEVEPAIVTSLDDIDFCAQQLRKEFGVEVDASSKRPAITLHGSLLQIQCAQSFLDKLFQQQQASQQEEFDHIGLETPRSTHGRFDLPERPAYDGRGEAMMKSMPSMHITQDRVAAERERINDLGLGSPTSPRPFLEAEKRVDEMFTSTARTEISRQSYEDQLAARRSESDELTARVQQVLKEVERHGQEEGLFYDRPTRSLADDDEDEEDRRSAASFQSLPAKFHADHRAFRQHGVRDDSEEDADDVKDGGRYDEDDVPAGRQFETVDRSRHSTMASSRMTEDTYFEDHRYGDDLISTQHSQAAGADILFTGSLDEKSPQHKEKMAEIKSRLSQTLPNELSPKKAELVGGHVWSTLPLMDLPTKDTTPQKTEGKGATGGTAAAKSTSHSPQSVATGKEFMKETLELDTMALNYVKKFYMTNINQLEESYGIMIDFEPNGEITTVNIYSIEEHADVPTMIKTAKSVFTSNYEGITRNIISETVTYDTEKFPSQEKNILVEVLLKNWNDRIYINGEEDGQVHVVGKYDYVVVVVDWLQQKLGAKPYTGYTPTGEPGLHSKFTIDSEGKRHRVLLMEEGAKATAGATTDAGKGETTGGRKGHKEDPAAPKPPHGGALTKSVRPSTSTYSSYPSGYHGDVSDTSNEADASGRQMFMINTVEKIAIKLYAANIVNLSTDVIVNAANESLSHVGGVALAISTAAGPAFQDACTKYINKFGPLMVGEVASTKACGKLRCSYVVHTVGPMWNQYRDEAQVKTVLGRCVTNCLTYASNKLQARSIAMPAISTGTYGVPVDVCAAAMLRSIVNYSKSYARHTSIKEVHIVTLDQEAINMMGVIITQLVAELETTKLIYGGDSSVRGDGGGRGCEVRADSTYTIPEHKACKNCWHSKEWGLKGHPRGGRGGRSALPAAERAAEGGNETDDDEDQTAATKPKKGTKHKSAAKKQTVAERLSYDETALKTLAVEEEIEGTDAATDVKYEDLFTAPPRKSPSRSPERSTERSSARSSRQNSRHHSGSAEEIGATQVHQERPTKDEGPSKEMLEFRSPREERRSPTDAKYSTDRRSSREDVRSPREDVRSPRQDVKSPREDVRSPRQDVRSPRQDVRSPRQDVKSPREDVRSPRQDVRSPRQDMRSPRQDVKSPREDVKSPREDITSPRQDVKSPRQDVKSPRQDVRSPREDIRSPRQDVKSPREDARYSRQDVTSPRSTHDLLSSRDEYDSERHQIITSPRQDVKSPRQDVTSPRQDVTSPRRDVTSPRQDVTSPRQGVTYPRQNITSPRQNITSPRQDVTSPRQGVTSPRQNIISPRQDVASPRQDVASPRQDVASPRQVVISPRPDSTTELRNAESASVPTSHDHFVSSTVLRLAADGAGDGGYQPVDGIIKCEMDRKIQIPGFEEHPGAIVITYTFPPGTVEGPNGPLTYNGMTRVAFLPNTPEGRNVQRLLQRAFREYMLFTVLPSGRTGQGELQWCIPHKTQRDGGPTRDGYPDPDYLRHVQLLLAEKGIRDERGTKVKDTSLESSPDI